MIIQTYEPKKHHPIQWFMYGSLLILAAAAATTLVWLNAPSRVLNIKSPITVHPVHAQREGAVVLTISYCKLNNSNGVVERRLVSDKTEIISAKMEDTSLKGCHDNVEIGVTIPHQASPDKYHFEYTATYKVNPLKTVVEEFRSEDFIVTDQQL